MKLDIKKTVSESCIFSGSDAPVLRIPGVPAGFQPGRSLEPAFRPGVSPDAEEEKRGH